MRSFLLVLFLLVSSAASCAGFDYDAYQTAKLSDVAGRLDVKNRPDSWVAPDFPRYHAQAVFTGRMQPIDVRVRAFVRLWIKSTGHPAGDIEMFKTQVEIKQDTVAYWMPIQETLVEQFKKEIPAGRRVDLFLLLMGACRQAPVFVINEFNATTANPIR